MKSFYRKIFILMFIVVISCKPSELKVKSIDLCENFNNEGICREKLEKEHTYNIIVKRSKKFETWDLLGNYLYFHSRQTPGFIVRFNRNFTMTEKEQMRKSYKSKYEFYGSSGAVEGFEMGEDWIGSFQYLGSIVKTRQRFFKEEKNVPYLENLFPASIKFFFDSTLAKGGITTEVNIQLDYKE